MYPLTPADFGGLFEIPGAVPDAEPEEPPPDVPPDWEPFPSLSCRFRLRSSADCRASRSPSLSLTFQLQPLLVGVVAAAGDSEDSEDQHESRHALAVEPHVAML